MENSCDISNVNFFQNVFRFVEQSIFNQSQTQLLCYKMKNLTFSSASCKNNPEQCARSAVSPSYLLKHQLWTWFPRLCLFGDCRLPLPSLPSCSRFCRGSVSACPKLQPRPGRPSVRQQKQQREVAWKWTAHQGLVRRGVVGLQAGAPIALAPNSFNLSNTLNKYSGSISAKTRLQGETEVFPCIIVLQIKLTSFSLFLQNLQLVESILWQDKIHLLLVTFWLLEHLRC